MRFVVFNIWFWICYLANICDVKEIFEMDVDDIFNEALGDVHKFKQTLHMLPFMTTVRPSSKHMSSALNNILAEGNTTSSPSHFATVHPNSKKLKRNINRTISKIDLDIQRILDDKQSPIPDFKNHDDELNVITRRYDSIRAHRKNEQTKLREAYYYPISYTDIASIRRMKIRMTDIMLQVVYETRYKLPYAEQLRTRFKENVKYKIGYCFALLRDLKQQQLVLYSALKMMVFSSYYTRTHTHLKLYHKVLKLDVDIKDVMEYIKQLDRERDHLDKLAPNLTTSNPFAGNYTTTNVTNK